MDLRQTREVQTPSSDELIVETKLSGIDPNIIIDNMEQDLEQAASFYANSHSEETFDELEQEDSFDKMSTSIEDDFEDGQMEEDSSDESKNEDLEGLQDDSPIF